MNMWDEFLMYDTQHRYIDLLTMTLKTNLPAGQWLLPHVLVTSIVNTVMISNKSVLDLHLYWPDRTGFTLGSGASWCRSGALRQALVVHDAQVRAEGSLCLPDTPEGP